MHFVYKVLHSRAAGPGVRGLYKYIGVMCVTAMILSVGAYYVHIHARIVCMCETSSWIVVNVPGGPD